MRKSRKRFRQMMVEIGRRLRTGTENLCVAAWYGTVGRSDDLPRASTVQHELQAPRTIDCWFVSCPVVSLCVWL